METPQPQIVSGYVRYRKETKQLKISEVMLPLALMAAIVTLTAFVYWQVAVTIAGITAYRFSGVAVERVRQYLATQEPKLVVRRNA